ncbi:mannosyltransferase [Polaribacter sp.]|nr:mannosyltransferase [Polaribacter sp.]
MSFFTKHKDVLLISLTTLLYITFAYLLKRIEFGQLLFLWLSLFGSFYLLLKNKKTSTLTLVGLVVLFRLIFLFATPNLSQDFYRFIWDGRMILKGFNPYLSLPETIIQQGTELIYEGRALYNGMGEMNGSHYTNYPPINQLCFFIAALFASKTIFGSVLVLRIIIILADIGVLYFGIKLLKRLNLPVKNIFWYALNPFIIIEMTGNLHFEPVMLFFLIWCLYKLHQQKWALGAVLFACSISVKLIPLLFLPLFYQWFIYNKSLQISKRHRFYNLIGFYAIILIITILLFLPFYSLEFVENYASSVSLWFQNFEFNASFYYIFREVGYLFSDWNQIAIIGKITPIMTIAFLIIVTFFRKNRSMIQMITALLFGICFYYFTTTTVHPWYLATPLILSIFTKYRFPIIWTIAIIFSYQVYANSPWQENLWFVALEYTILYGFMIFEINKNFKIIKA